MNADGRLSPERLAAMRAEHWMPSPEHDHWLCPSENHIEEHHQLLAHIAAQQAEIDARWDDGPANAATRRECARLTGLLDEYRKQFAEDKAEIDRLAGQVAALREAAENVRIEHVAPFGEALRGTKRMREVLADTEADAKAHDQRLRLEGARALVERATELRDGTTPNWEIAARNWIRQHLTDMEREAGQ